MSIKEILKEIKNVISQETGIESEEISLNSHFSKDLNIDDFEFANLMANIEERFGTEIGPEDISKIKTVQDLVHILEDNLQ